MADIVNGIQINKLPEATSIADEDILILENAERTQKVSVGALRENVDTQGVNFYLPIENVAFENFRFNYSQGSGKTVEVVRDSNVPSGVCIKFGFTPTNSAGTGVYFDERYISNKKMEKGKIYTLSFYAKASEDGLAFHNNEVFNVKTNEIFGNPDMSISSEWKFYKIVFMRENIDITICLLYLRNCKVGAPYNLYISSAKLEPGTVTDPVWTPSPQDVVVRLELENRLKGFGNVFFDKTVSGATYAIDSSGLYLLFLSQGGAQDKYGMYFIRKTMTNSVCHIDKIAGVNFEVKFSEDYSSIVITSPSVPGDFNVSLFKVMDFT